MSKNYDVVVNPGHGGNDPGAVVRNDKEKTKVLTVCKEIDRTLERHGLKVLLTRDSDESEGAAEIIRECNGSGADLALSVHLNVDADPDTLDDGAGDGFEIYHYKTSEKGKKLAKCIEKRVVNGMGQNSRGLKTADLFFTRDTIMPAVLAELWFMDNKKDRAIGDTEAELKAWGVEIAKGILDYKGITFKAEKTAEKKPAAKKTLYRVQVGAFYNKDNAEKLKEKLEKKGYSAHIVEG